MGCDIHMLLERKTEAGWQLVRTFDPITDENGAMHWPASTMRNYERFAALAGVRGDGPEPRGLPSDISAAALAAIDEGAFDHSRSWLPVSEAALIFLATEHAPKLPEFARDYPAYHYFHLEEVDLEEYRLIFGFDS